ncbi:MAG: TIR domain-containing protein [Betaproteobacteria bacterium]|nr:TIR domain-containing protein [Betaproteobacteria bacterium]MCL2885253.1 TIR domain-containing protein [Betaproteobacteria bacterium]
MSSNVNYSRAYDVFVSYRRDGGETMAILIRDRLASKGFNVFLDVESLNSGNFNTKLLQVIESCNDFVAVLSPGALDRCANEDDWVRAEIAHAIKHNKNIVPIMLRGFEWPEHLPEDIADLPMKNGVNANNNEYFDAAIDRLTEKFLLSKPMKLFDKISLFAKNAVDKTSEVIESAKINEKISESRRKFSETKTQFGDMVDVSKLNTRISDSKYRVNNIKQKLGDYYWGKYKEGVALDAEADKLCAAIKDEVELIDECNREIQKIKKIPETGNAAKPAEDIKCAECSAILPSDAKFCPECGAVAAVKAPEPAPEVVLCSNCGAQISSDRKFCQECGTRL